MKTKIQTLKIENVKNWSKKLFAVALLFIGMTAFAQENKSKQHSDKEQFTTEQKAQLRLKKLILELDLTTSQQKEMSVIIAEQSAKREQMKKDREANKASGKKLTSDERFAKVNKMLDEKIAMKARIKSILSADQFAKWEKMKEQKNRKMKGKMKKSKSRDTQKTDLPKE